MILARGAKAPLLLCRITLCCKLYDLNGSPTFTPEIENSSSPDSQWCYIQIMEAALPQRAHTMNHRLAGKYGNVKIAKLDRRYVSGGHTACRHVTKAYNRAVRKAAKQECRQAA